MSVGHYENFPVGSLVLPRRLRRPVHAIYAFARTADDIAVALKNDPRIDRFSVESENFESIHNHSAYALIEYP